jgi:1-acyl-sn-glycerol-3-phosphate acyltransferase
MNETRTLHPPVSPRRLEDAAAAPAASRRPWGTAVRFCLGTVRLVSFAGIAAGTRLALAAGAVFAANPSRWRSRVFGTSARFVARLVGMRVTVEGAAPQAPFFLVSNHLSYVDIVLLASQLPCRFVAKREVRGWPLLGSLAAALGTIFLDRADHRDILRVNDRIGEALDAGEGVVVFAEGTSTGGDGVLPLRPSLLEVPARRAFPVTCAAISYRTPGGEPSADRSVCWWGDMRFPDHLFRLLMLPGFHARLTFASAPVCESDRKHLARELYQRITEKFTPVVPSSAPTT